MERFQGIFSIPILEEHIDFNKFGNGTYNEEEKRQYVPTL